MKILIAVPAYNCESQIANVIRQYTYEDNDLYSELLIINNRSTDKTLENAIETSKLFPKLNITIITNAENYGLGGTHKVAFQYCSERNYNGVVIIHGDDQGTLSDIGQFLTDPNKTFDCLLGARFMPNSKLIGYPKLRVLGNNIFNWLYSVTTGKKIYDMGSGLNFYSKSLIDKGIHNTAPDDLTFNNYYLLNIILNHERFSFFPISWKEDGQISNAKLINQSIKLFKYLILFSIRRRHKANTINSSSKFINYSFTVNLRTFSEPIL
jgi:glycosyltransferase involved in cell wall biosynthesis